MFRPALKLSVGEHVCIDIPKDGPDEPAYVNEPRVRALEIQRLLYKLRSDDGESHDAAD